MRISVCVCLMSLLRWLYGSLIVGILYRYDMITKLFSFFVNGHWYFFHLNHGWEFELIVINVLDFSDITFILLGLGVHYVGHFLWCFESWCPEYWTSINQHNFNFSNIQILLLYDNGHII